MPELKKIPFDSLCLAAVCAELQVLIGGKLQRIIQPSWDVVVLGIYAGGEERHLSLCVHPMFGRIHLISSRGRNPADIPHLCRTMRAKLDGARVMSITQVGFDRILKIELGTQEGVFTLIAEIMGKHSNLLLVDPDGKIASAAKWLSPSQSARPIGPTRPYTPPPVDPMPSLWSADGLDDLKGREGASPFLVRWLQAEVEPLDRLRQRVEFEEFQPVLAEGFGAYPVDVRALGYSVREFGSISHALETHYEDALPAYEAEQRKRSLFQQLERVTLARQVAIQSLEEVLDTSRRAAALQLKGELILAYGNGLEEGATKLEAHDYSGEPITISLNPDLDFKQNAERFFHKAKRAKASASDVAEQMQRLSAEMQDVHELLARLEAATDPDEVDRLREAAKARRWLFDQPEASQKKEDRPYEGKKVRELIGPGSERVFFGENSEANDYLTLRIAKPNDIWLHVRGSQSTHVVIQTHNQPDKISREALLFAAQVAVKHSVAKHSSYVEVDYTLKKYVRKPKGSPTGFAVYTHEKTLRIERD
ncbi:MAG: NFACT family protein [Fimbriimonadaceae bacterium]|nr:NFACT family protein [Fimbriimonadaceae bacterium]